MRDRLGWLLLLIFAVIFPILGFPRCLRVLLLVYSWRLFCHLHLGQQPLVYRICGVLETSRARPELPMANEGGFGRTDQSPRI